MNRGKEVRLRMKLRRRGWGRGWCVSNFFMNRCLHALSPHCILFIALCSRGCLRNTVKVLYIHCACGFSRGSILIALYFFIVDQKYTFPPLETEILVVISEIALRAHSSCMMILSVQRRKLCFSTLSCSWSTVKTLIFLNCKKKKTFFKSMSVKHSGL